MFFCSYSWPITVQQQSKYLYDNRAIYFYTRFIILSRTGARFRLQILWNTAWRNRFRAVPQLPCPLYRCNGSVEIETRATMCSKPCRGLLPVILADTSVGCFFVTGNDILRYLILIMNLGFAMTLNPFFKFDGYWIASDLLGVPNLRQRSLELFSYMWNRLKKRPIKQLPYLLQMIPPLALLRLYWKRLAAGKLPESL